MRSDYVSAQLDAPVFHISADTALFVTTPDSSCVLKTGVTSLCKGYTMSEGCRLIKRRGREHFLPEVKLGAGWLAKYWDSSDPKAVFRVTLHDTHDVCACQT